MIEITDLERARFLRKLDDSDVTVSDWEAKFIESCMDRQWFSPKQRVAIDAMVEKYGKHIK